MPLCGTHRGRKGVAGCSAYPLWLLWSSPNEWGLETRFSSQYANFPVPSAGGRGVPACHASPPSAPMLCCRKVRVNHDTPMICATSGVGGDPWHMNGPSNLRPARRRLVRAASFPSPQSQVPSPCLFGSRRLVRVPGRLCRSLRTPNSAVRTRGPPALRRT